MDILHVRQLVTTAVAERGLAPATIVGETVMVRGGYYVGRRFMFEGLEAVWMLDALQVGLQTDEGETLPPIDLQAGESQRPAA